MTNSRLKRFERLRANLRKVGTNVSSTSQTGKYYAYITGKTKLSLNQTRPAGSLNRIDGIALTPFGRAEGLYSAGFTPYSRSILFHKLNTSSFNPFGHEDIDENTLHHSGYFPAYVVCNIGTGIIHRPTTITGVKKQREKLYQARIPFGKRQLSDLEDDRKIEVISHLKSFNQVRSCSYYPELWRNSKKPPIIRQSLKRIVEI